MWRRRISMTTRWACTLLSVVIVAAWVWSLYWAMMWIKPDPKNGCVVNIECGAMDIYVEPIDPSAPGSLLPPAGFNFLRLRWPSRVRMVWRPEWTSSAAGTVIIIPFYLPSP